MWAKSLNPAQSYGYFSKIEDGALRHLVSPKMIILVTLSTTCFHSAPAYLFWWESAHLRHRNCTFMKSKLAAAVVLYFGTFSQVIQFMVLFCTYIQNLSQIHQSWAKLWLFFQNSRWRPPPSCFCENDDFGHVFYYRVSFCTSVPNLMLILPSTA